MTKSFSRGLVLAAGLLASPAVADPDPIPAEMVSQKDPRWILVKQFFLDNGAPAHLYTDDFLIAADLNGLDWRLLPSLSIIESGGGREARNNNMFGWDNCRVHFRSVKEGIYRVASWLKNSSMYRSKTSIDQILWTYNPRKEYTRKVRALMAQLGPVELVPAAGH
ncbi:MAG: hypothetical protein P4K98_08175 [Bryobacteraceae bacterium]|nr:hypothetical protein [Bryobacteraceae bacterium]